MSSQRCYDAAMYCWGLICFALLRLRLSHSCRSHRCRSAYTRRQCRRCSPSHSYWSSSAAGGPCWPSCPHWGPPGAYWSRMTEQLCPQVSFVPSPKSFKTLGGFSPKLQFLSKVNVYHVVCPKHIKQGVRRLPKYHLSGVAAKTWMVLMHAL